MEIGGLTTVPSLDLEGPVSLHENVYLGCGQKSPQPDLEMISQKCEMFERICHSSADGKPDTIVGGTFSFRVKIILLHSASITGTTVETPRKSRVKKKTSIISTADSQSASTAGGS